ncbi:MAG: MFS transporter [Pseudomonadota bacterium]
MTDSFPKKWYIFGVVALGVFMSTLDSSIVNVALPHVMEDLGTQLQVIQWVVLMYLLTVSSLLLTFGRLSDIRGRRLVYCAGFLTFTLGSLCCGISREPLFLILSRGVQGCGASMLMACSPALVVDAFPPAERGKALGLVGTVVASGLTTGPVIGGLILDHLSWRYIFFINIPIGLAATLAGAAIMKGTPADTGIKEPLDTLGSLFLILTLGGFLVFMTHINQWPLDSPFMLISAVLCLASGVGFVRTELTSPFPLIDPGLMRIRLFVFPVLAAALMFASLFTIVFLMPFYLTHPMGLSASATGVVMITPFLVQFFLSPVTGSLYNRTGSRILCTLGMVLMACALFSFTMLKARVPVASIIWRLAMAGFGTALFIPPNSAAAMTSIPARRRGIASGAVALVRNFGMVFGVALAGLVFDTTFSRLNSGQTFTHYTPEMAGPFMTALGAAMSAGALLAFLGVVVSWMRGPEKPDRPSSIPTQ